MDQVTCQCRAGCTAKKSCSCKKAGRLCRPQCHPNRTCHNQECIRKTGPVVNADASSIKDSTSQAWVNIGPGFELQTSDKEVISDRKWLNDKIISAWQFLLKRKFPKVGGLQPTVIVEKLEPTKDGMAQVLNCGNNHWVAMSTIGCGEGKVQWLDSFHGEPSTAKQKLIADMLKTEVDEITVSIMNVQKQVGTADCGLFALAFVTAAVHGHNPTELYFDQKNMRSHLIESLQKMEASMFPVIKTQMKRRDTLKQITIPVYCICRLPESDRMVECTGCLKWFHVGCVGSEQSFSDSWYCSACL